MSVPPVLPFDAAPTAPDYPASIVTALHRFWFGDVPVSSAEYKPRHNLWFGAPNPDLDACIRQHFERPLLDVVTNAEILVPKWTANPHYTLALIILLDQFSRNMYRGTPRMFTQDALALQVCKQLLESMSNEELRATFALLELTFILLPLEHSESVECVEECMWRLATLVDDPVHGKYIGLGVEATRQHLQLLQKFGRYPHRNAPMGRASTEEELAYLRGVRDGFESTVKDKQP